jgi:IclR family KDG regulon transcriptional repressor
MAPVPAVKRALNVLELLAEQEEPMTLSEIANKTKIPMASCHAIIHTLEECGYLERRQDGRTLYWEPTLALYHLGSLVISRYGIREVARPYLRELSEALDLPAHLGVLAGSDVVYVEKVATSSFIQFKTFPGKMAPFQTTALGRAIVAALPEKDRSELVNPRDRRLAKALKQAREDGFAREDSEEIDGIGCIAAPVFDGDGTVVASVGVTGFSQQLFPNGDVPAAKKIVAAARSISQELGHR